MVVRRAGWADLFEYIAPRAFERLGLIVGSVLAASGVLLFFGFAKDDGMSVFVHALKEFHELWGRQ